jgi:hypothetical protein
LRRPDLDALELTNGNRGNRLAVAAITWAWIFPDTSPSPRAAMALATWSVAACSAPRLVAQRRALGQYATATSRGLGERLCSALVSMQMLEKPAASKSPAALATQANDRPIQKTRR